ncbi:NAD(P)H-binding protein [Kribbella italica]|uniref:Uncharacterized protein YbjT (DUF2867 family) n=1 Tax=Kribbella italica TaxID=1540520 RepID=A0A7W9J530_9ACTN|nr:NAD(P)H-binding protein [Kribbella italica]MBB5835535.1 uncharacterized protein YbjT (DUF2867 family) [Kribbella italica]
MITVTTPTGQIGRVVLDHLLNSPLRDRLRVIVRDPDRLPSGVRERVDVVQGSHDDPEVLAKAFAGATSVFWLVPPNPQATDVDEYYLDFAREAAKAIQQYGVRRLVGVSTLGRGVAENAGLLSAALAADELIGTTGVAQRTICAPYFLENFLNQADSIRQGVLSLPMDGDRRLRTCATADLAAVAADLLLDESWTGQSDVPVAGPDHLTLDEMAQVMSEVLGRRVGFRSIGDAEYEEALTGYGVSAAWAEGLSLMAKAQNEQAIYDSAELRLLPTSLREWFGAAFTPGR